MGLIAMTDSMMQYMAVPLPEDVDSALKAGDEALANQIIAGYLKRDIPLSLTQRLLLER